jgi:polyisoprenoid-binding protein YceI
MKPLLALFALFASPAVYNVESAQTTVEYSVDSTLHTVHGTFALKRAALNLDPTTGRAEGELVVDANSGASGSEARDHRMTREILETAKYPEIVFRPDRIDGKLAPEGESHLALHGVIAIHGAQHELTAQVDARPIAEGYDATARFDIPYVDWGMKNPSNFVLRVNKVVKVTVHTVVTYKHSV